MSFNPAWDEETLTEFLKYRRHKIWVPCIRTRQDLDNFVLRLLKTTPLSCRKKVTAYVLQRRHYCSYFCDAALLKAIDCSFRYTGRAYAFEKALRMRIHLAFDVPEIFFRQAGRKIRQRKYAAWLREHRYDLEDMSHSLSELKDEQKAAFTGWSALERHSREWHARQIGHAVAWPDDDPFAPAPCFSPAPIDALRAAPPVFHQDGYVFTLLDSAAAMAEEGAAMRHCLASYIGNAVAGLYAAYKVEGHQERATLGLRRTSR